jgi:hypothetical protein
MVKIVNMKKEETGSSWHLARLAPARADGALMARKRTLALPHNHA